MTRDDFRQRLSAVLRDTLRLLTFRRPSRAMAERWQDYFFFGLFCTWLAGLGRYWDSPQAEWWQRLGLGSVGYVFVLSLVLFVIIAPLRPQRWRYRNVLIFVMLTSPPAILYAIPVEQFMTLEKAQAANAIFLGVVATWRLALLFWFLKVVAGLRGGMVMVATLLPMCLIVVALAALNLEHAMFNIMSGIAPEDRTPGDLAYEVVVTIAVLSVLFLPILLMVYAIGITIARRRTVKGTNSETPGSCPPE